MKEKENNNNKNEKKGKIIDKVVMGAVIGGAIGSVIGASIKKGKTETPKVEQPEKPKKKGLIRRLIGVIFKKKEKKKIPSEGIAEQNAEQNQATWPKIES